MPPTTKTRAPRAVPPPKPRKSRRLRALKFDDELWEAAQAKAKEDGLTMTAVVEHYLRGYTGLE